jgi:hypothetical protein
MEKPRDSNAEFLFVKDFCVPFLLGAQNQDGGWGFVTKSNSRVEPTCWAIRALRNSPVPISKESFKSAFDYLLSAQLKDGSWSSVAEATSGSWVTSLASSVLSQDKIYSREVHAALKWLCDDYPRDSALWRRLLQRLRSSEPISSHDDSYRGWGWTPRTASWVEPTAFAIQALRDCREDLRPGAAANRLELATGLLYDRTCPNGGWNCGNPMVLTSGWALLALRDYPSHERKSMSLDWLARTFPRISSAASHAVARITLETHGRELPKTHRSLPEMFDPRAFLRTTETVAWTSLALSPKRSWFPKMESAA